MLQREFKNNSKVAIHPHNKLSGLFAEDFNKKLLDFISRLDNPKIDKYRKIFGSLVVAE